MNKNQIKGKLNQFKGDAKVWWGEATGDNLAKLDGTKDKIKGYFQEQKGMLEEDADKEVAKFEKAKEAFETRKDEVNTKIKAKWDKLSHKDVEDIDGSFEHFSEKIKEKYNTSKEEANTKVKEFMASID